MADPAFDPEFSPPPPAKPSDPVGRAFAWLRAREPWVIVAAIGFQLMVLSSMVVGQVLPTFGAPTVLLRVVPVDPRDLMRGDYVTLDYEINRLLPGGRFSGEPGRTVYVELVPEPDGRHYRGRSVSDTPPPSGRFIRGTVGSGGRLTFGIESYYVQEGKGHDYERAILNHRLSAEVALARDGRAALRRLVFD